MMNNQNLSHTLLGETTVYPTRYCPEVLCAIARQPHRDIIQAALGDVAGIAQGVDWWHAFEVSWLDGLGKPTAKIGRFTIPANSPYLVESKSFKLYLNGMNFWRFESEAAFIQCVETDLSAVAQAPVRLTLLNINDLAVSIPTGQCIDHLELTTIVDHPTADLLQWDTTHDQVVVETLYSDLLRSNCPITNQPDWATIILRYEGRAICHRGLLNYLVSYRQHADFHEQCIEKIYADLYKKLQPTRLMVYAMYTRRGGLDINPCRVSHLDWLPAPLRLARQ